MELYLQCGGVRHKKGRLWNETMRKTFHICLASHDEVLFRSEEDFNHAFNCFAVAAVLTESRVLGESFMSDHMHNCIQSDSPEKLMKRYRYAYTRYFNAKYHRHGRLGDRGYFMLEMEGLRHIMAGLSYVFRQGLHHGLCETAFAYPHSSVNCIFRKELGRDDEPRLIEDKSRYLYLPDHCSLSTKYRMSESGLLVREDIIDTQYVEELFITPKSFLYYMNRQSDEKWKDEQNDDNSKQAPVTLKMIESRVACSIDDLSRNEYGKVNKSHMTDQELCSYIDSIIVPRFNVFSIYGIPLRKRKELAEKILQKFSFGSHSGNGKYVTQKQVARCMVLEYV